MNKEIKEILDAWKNKKYILAYTSNYDSAREQNEKLLNYITNLEQELKQTQELALEHQRINRELREENKNIISESLSYDLAVARVKKLEYRIDKAIEKTEKLYKNAYKYGANNDTIVFYELLNILKGEE